MAKAAGGWIRQGWSSSRARSKINFGKKLKQKTTPTYESNKTNELSIELAHSLSIEAFAPIDPKTAQDEMPVEKYAAVLERLKPTFIHHPRAKQLIPSLLKELGCDIKKTYFDVPRLRTSTSDNYLTTGIACAFHPHRDTWYSAPQCQLNWWIPVYEITPGLRAFPNTRLPSTRSKPWLTASARN